MATNTLIDSVINKSVAIAPEDLLLALVGKNIKDLGFENELEVELRNYPKTHENVQYLTMNLRTENAPIVWASGNYFIDANGKVYLDVCAQTQNLNFGHNHPKIIKAAVDSLQSTEPYYTSSKFGNIPSLELSEKLRQFLPNELNRVNLKMLNGADSVETALKCAVKYHTEKGSPERQNIISLNWAHHGHTMKTMACTNKYAHLSYVPLENHIHIDANDLAQLRENMKKEKGVAAIIMEPILMNGGAVPITQEFMDEVAKLCKQEDIVLIFDEVQTAFGWTGTMFGLEHYNVVPDIICLSKALASGLPCSACIMKSKYDNLDFGEAEFTAGMNPVSAKVALTNIQLLTQDNMLQEITVKAAYFRSLLEDCKNQFPNLITKINGIGLMLGIETKSPDIAAFVYKNALSKGVLLRVSKDGKGESVIVKPSLITTKEQLDKIATVIKTEFEAFNQ